MSLDVQRKLSKAMALGQAERYDEATAILKEVATEATDSWLRLTTANLVVTEMSAAIRRQGEFPDRGTREHTDLLKYLQLFIESYDRATAGQQKEFGDRYGHEVIGKRRQLFELLGDPSRAEQHFNQAQAFSRQGAYEAAFSEYERALDCSPPPDLEMITCHGYALAVWKHTSFSPVQVLGVDHSVFRTEEDAKQASKIEALCDLAIHIYETEFRTGTLLTSAPVKGIYEDAQDLKLKVHSASSFTKR